MSGNRMIIYYIGPVVFRYLKVHPMNARGRSDRIGVERKISPLGCLNNTVKSEIKAAPDYKPLSIIGRTKLPNLYNISRSLLQAASPQWEKSADFCSYLSKN